MCSLSKKSLCEHSENSKTERVFGDIFSTGSTHLSELCLVSYEISSDASKKKNTLKISIKTQKEWDLPCLFPCLVSGTTDILNSLPRFCSPARTRFRSCHTYGMHSLQENIDKYNLAYKNRSVNISVLNWTNQFMPKGNNVVFFTEATTKLLLLHYKADRNEVFNHFWEESNICTIVIEVVDVSGARHFGEAPWRTLRPANEPVPSRGAYVICTQEYANVHDKYYKSNVHTSLIFFSFSITKRKKLDVKETWLFQGLCSMLK